MTTNEAELQLSIVMQNIDDEEQFKKTMYINL
jgi:hypothetical protein